MKNKGFTLIELLGVITILALLMILVFPSIINSVRNSSSKTDQLTLDLIYNASKLYISNNVNNYPKTNGNKYIIELKDLVDEGLLVSPIKLSNSDADITNNKCIQVTYNDGYNFELKESGTCEEIRKICTAVTTSSVGNIPIKGVYNPGDEYICNVDGTSRTFFILNVTGNDVTMIMNDDIANSVDWGKDMNVNADDQGCEAAGYCGSTNSGPFTAMNKIHQLTQNWTVPSININYDDSTYGGIITTGTTTVITNSVGDSKVTYENLKARLPLYSEVKDLGAALWLVVNTTGKSDDSDQGYWTLSSSNLSSAYFVGTDGVMDSSYIRAEWTLTQAIRPVIELTKDHLLN